jgi:hypothetical protein
MSRALSDTAPQIAQGLHQFVPSTDGNCKTCSYPLKDPVHTPATTQSAEISQYLTARFSGESIMLCCGELEILRLSPATFRALNEFAVRIGWSCD